MTRRRCAPPASPEPERCAECGMPRVGNQHVPVDRCTVYPSEASGCVEPERHHPFQPTTPPESAEALRDLTFEQAATKALAIAFHRAEGRCRGHYAPRCGEECDRFAERVGPTLAVWLGWYGIAAARATPPLTVERLARALDGLRISGPLGVAFTEAGHREYAAAILAALEQDR